MEDEPVSPAVKSLLNEQAEQTAKRKTRLDKGLEDTFPASDPVSVTHTATATGSGAAGAQPQESELLGLHPSDGPIAVSTDDHRAELDAVRQDLENLRDRIHSASGKSGAAHAQGDAFERRVEQMIGERPLATVGLVGALSFILGVGYGARMRGDR